jgi:hypothetical protein
MHYDSSFVYFLYYLDLFPVATTDPFPELNRAAAEKYLTARPKTLVMDIGWTWLEGDRGKILLYSLDTWLKGAPWNPSVRPFNRFAFTVSLCLLFASFWWIRRPILGGVLVILLGSNPFQLYEVHLHENVHGWTITTAILLLALHVPWLATRRPDRRYAIALPLVTGILVGTIRSIRSEPAAMLLAAALSYLFIDSFDWRRRLAMVSGLALAFLLTNAAWNGWFAKKDTEARNVLTTVGGHPFTGPLRQHHALWHPIWCGLGDFGQKHGYEWEDTKALAYARPVLESQYHETVPASFDTPSMPAQYWDPDHLYRKLPYGLGHYDEVVRDKVLHDIAHDPLWYGGVLLRRAWRLLTELTPARAQWGAHWVGTRAPGLLALPLLLLLLVARNRFLLGLLFFTLPTCIAPMLVFSGRGMAYYAIYHLIALGIIIALAIENVRWWISRRRRIANR